MQLSLHYSETYSAQ